MSGLSAIFDAVSYTPPKKSTFEGFHDIKTSCKIGDVFPLDVIPVYPSDNFRMQYTSQAKFHPLVAPAFARMNLKQWSFYVRNADLWDDFQEFVSGVSPKLGQTAYNPDKFSTEDLVHPYIKCDYSLLRDMHIGVRLNISGVDLSKISYDVSNAEYHVDREYFKQLCGALSTANSVFSFVFSYGDEINALYGYDVRSTLSETYGGNELNALVFNASRNGSTSDYITFRTGPFTENESIDSREGNSNTEFFKVHGRKYLAYPGGVLDYLGYPSFDYRAQFANGQMFQEIANLPNQTLLKQLYEGYVCDGNSVGFQALRFRAAMDEIYNGDEISSEWHAYGPTFCPQMMQSYLNDRSASTLGGFEYMDYDSNYKGDNDFGISFRGILLRYLQWCYDNKVTSTLVGDAPCFSGVRFRDCVSKEDSQGMDSLRLRAYWKIWNDYYRHPNLTYEVPIPYSLGGNDYDNFYKSVYLFSSSQTSGPDGHIYDWYGKDWLGDGSVWTPFVNFSHKISMSYFNNICFSDTLKDLINFVFLDDYTFLIYKPFKHLRERDYITGCLPNTSVVDVVAPIMPNDALASYDVAPWTNDSMKVKDGSNVHDNTSIDPINATKDAYEANVGWLDIENLRITQKLKEYFVSLRHTLGSFKDFVKVFFGADISDLTLHRAEFLGGNSQNVSISELVSSAEALDSPQGSLAGRANSFGSSGLIDKFVNDYGFIITLECLSPIEINVGGLSRQLIRDTRFDYFNPKFAELGDMAVTKKEVSAAIPYLGYNGAFDDIFGYTPRYMDLKFIPSHVHGDFLGSMSDWHLDLLHSVINTNKVELSQQWLQEVEDDRIFAETYEDSSDCFIWSECSCVYQRALPARSYDVIA